MVDQRFLSRLAFFASLFALGVVALGAFTRLMDAGLGCPDWPGCYGHWTAPLTDSSQSEIGKQFPNSDVIVYKAWAEMIHRYFVAILSLFIISIVGSIFVFKNVRNTKNIILALFLIALLIYQITLGQLTVTLKLLPIIVTQHLLGGFLILSTLWLIFLSNNTQLKIKINATKSPFIFLISSIGLILLCMQIFLGAWTSTNYASLSCADFPFCVNEKIMSWQFKEAFKLFYPIGVNYEGGVLSEAARQTIQMTHRIGAFIITCYLFFLASFLLTCFKLNSEVIKTTYLIVALLLLQISLGISNVIFKLPLIVALSHNIVAALLLLSLITLLFKIFIANTKAR